MAYVTSAQIVTRLGNEAAVQLTTGSGTTVDTDLIDEIIVEVEADIDQVLQLRTSETITQSSYPKTFAMARGKAVAMTIYQLALRRPPVSDDWKSANDQAVQWLKDLAEGKIALPDADLSTPGLEHGAADQNAAAMDR